MSVNVYIPTPFRHLVGNRASVKAKGATVRDILGDLDTQFPGSAHRSSMRTAGWPATSTST